MKSLDVKGIGIYLAITLGLAFAIYLAAAAAGLAESDHLGRSYMAVALLILYAPAAAAIVASRVHGEKLTAPIRFWPIPWGAALVAVAGFPLLFLLVYAVMSLAGAASPDWQMTTLAAQLPPYREAGLDEPYPTSFLLVGSATLSILLGPTVYALAFAGHELGWRGYLFTKLQPLGLARAHIITGLLWALWLSPIVLLGFTQNESRVVGLGALVIAAIAISAVFNEVWRRSYHVGLTAIWAGCFAAQLQEGVWRYLFPDTALPMGGAFGVIAVVVWGLTAIALLYLPESVRFAPAPAVVVEHPSAEPPVE